MISEYAIDPACVKQVEELLRVLAGIGGQHGRVIAEFPGGWANRVRDAAKRVGLLPMQSTKLARRLALVRHAIVDTGRSYEGDEAWSTNASNVAPPFRAIVSVDQNGDHVIPLGCDLEEHACWSIRRGLSVERKAAALSAALEPLLRHAHEVTLVDPHFAPETARWRRPLVALLRAAHRHGKATPHCEFHLKAKATPEFFANALREQLGPELPEGSSITFVRWTQRTGGEDLHRRLVLTEFAGVGVDYGLDEGASGEVTDVMLLDHETWERRRADFSVGSRAFQMSGVPLRVSKDQRGRVDVQPVQDPQRSK